MIYERAEPATLSPFICMQASKKKENSRFRWTLSQLGVYSRAMVNLVSQPLADQSIQVSLSLSRRDTQVSD